VHSDSSATAEQAKKIRRLEKPNSAQLERRHECQGSAAA